MRHKSSNFRFFPVYNVQKDQYSQICGEPCQALTIVQQHAYVPFQLVSQVDLGTISYVFLHNKCTGVTDPTDYANTTSFYLKDIDQDGVDEYIYTFYGGVWYPANNGVYEVRIHWSTGQVWYSETFAVRECEANDCTNNWHLEWWHSCADKGLGDYDMNFKNRFDLGEIVLQHDGEIENIISRRDGFGAETIVSSEVRQKYSFDFIGTSWMLESLKVLKLYDNIFLHRSENSDNFQLSNIEVTTKGSIDDCFFPIKISFTKDVLITTKCCDSVYEQAPVPGNCAGMSVMTSADFSVCDTADPVELTATVIGGAAPFVYVWSNGDTGQTIEVQPTETTTYIVTAIDAYGCVKQDQVTITVVTCEGVLVVGIVADPATPVCTGASVDLDLSVSGGSGVYTYLWNTGATTQDITVAPTTTQVYSVTVTDTISGDVAVATINVVVLQLPEVTIIVNGCDLSIQLIEECDGTPTYQWQVETAPDTWGDAGGSDTGTTYTGTNGSTYRLAVTCDGCTGYSNEITVVCSEPCTVAIDSITYNDTTDELTVTYSGVLGSNPLLTGFVRVDERVDPGCDVGGYQLVIIVSIATISGTEVIPYTRLLATEQCVRVSVSINGAECEDTEYYLIPD